MGGFGAIFKGLLGGDPVKSITDLIGEFHMSPEDKAKLQQAAQELEVKRQEIEAARDEALANITLQNTQGARAMQISVKSILPPLLAIVVSLGFFGLLYIIAFKAIPESSKDVLYVMTGTLGTAWVAIVNYYYGSSQGSTSKDDILSQHLSALTAAKTMTKP